MCQKCSTQIGLDWLCYLAGNSQTAPMIFFHIFSIHFFNYFIKHPQTTNALTLLTHNISAIGGVLRESRAEGSNDGYPDILPEIVE